MSERDQQQADKATEVHLCRTCGGEITIDVPTFPFCSDRCPKVDLGKWFDGDYRISRAVKDIDIETVD